MHVTESFPLKQLPQHQSHVLQKRIDSAGIFHLRVPESSAVGSAVGRIKAHDLDIGKNAAVEYNIVPGDGGAMFDITTNEHNQEGIIMLKKVKPHLKCNMQIHKQVIDSAVDLYYYINLTLEL